jgi:hypothetical protein
LEIASVLLTVGYQSYVKLNKESHYFHYVCAFQLLDALKEGEERMLSFERGSSGSHYVESSLWKRLWTCHKTDY